jgi:hypothetical protein
LVGTGGSFLVVSGIGRLEVPVSQRGL